MKKNWRLDHRSSTKDSSTRRLRHIPQQEPGVWGHGSRVAEFPNFLQLSCLLPSEAEHIVASVWRALVTYDIATPRLSVRSVPGGLLELSLEFGTAQEADRCQGRPGSQGIATVAVRHEYHAKGCNGGR